MKCRHCDKNLEHNFMDLGFAPPSNAYLTPEKLKSPELYFPLNIKVCDQCWLVQTEDYTEADALFDADYAYFSSTSKGWLKHAEIYTDKMIEALDLTSSSFVIEIASNDGYLLKNFKNKDIPCLGVEPTDSTADAAEELGIEVIRKFFGEELGKDLASQGRQADLIAGNNVYAHVPDINDFTKGLKAALKPTGTITLEFPHLMQLILQNQFDTIYHEHFSYLSLSTVRKIFKKAGLKVFDVEELTTHGGSLRIFGCHDTDTRKETKNVERIINAEIENGLNNIKTYNAFQKRADKVKDDLLNFLVEQKRLDKKVAAYGAAAKGNTLLNYAGIKPDLLPFVCDAAEAKQGKFMPGSHIPILKPAVLEKYNPDFVIILPWNIANEVMEQNKTLKELGTKFVIAVPQLEIR